MREKARYRHQGPIIWDLYHFWATKLVKLNPVKLVYDTVPMLSDA